MQNNDTEQVYAGFFVRLAAYFVDTIMVGIALLAVRIPLWGLRLSDWNNFIFKNFIFHYSIEDILLYVLHAAYFILMTYFSGATLGKRLLHIRVVSAKDRDFTFFEIVYRETVGRFLAAIIVYLGYLMVIVNREKAGLHDILSDTRVMYCHVKKVNVNTPVTYKYMGNEPLYGMPPQNGYGNAQTNQTQPYGTQTQNAYGNAQTNQTQPYGTQTQNAYGIAQTNQTQPYGTQTQNAYGSAQTNQTQPYGTQTQNAYGNAQGNEPSYGMPRQNSETSEK